MNTDHIATQFEERAPLSYLVVSLAVGLVLGLALSPVYQPFGTAAGLFGGSAVTFFALALWFGGPV